MQDARIRVALIVVGLVCLLGSGAVLLAGHRSQPPPVTITPPPTDATTNTPSNTPASPPDTRLKPVPRVYVDVAGSVRRPSLYVLPAGSRVMQAILVAGGPTAAADLDAVNLAQKVTDGEKVFVPKRGTSPPPAPPTEVANASPTSDVPTPKTSGKTAKGDKAGHVQKLTAESGEQIALNTATAEDLERLPGVGPSMAGRILAYRQQAGGFGKIEDLLEVTGLGPKKFAKISPFVKLD